MFNRQPLGFHERMDLRRHLSQQISSGVLPAEAGILLSNRDAFVAYQEQVAQLRATATPSGSPAHPILSFLISHWTQIYALIQMLLPLFGGPKLPNLPTLPPVTPTPPATPVTAIGMPTEFSIQDIKNVDWAHVLDQLESAISTAQKLLAVLKLTKGS